jgi:hypothetical protein
MKANIFKIALDDLYDSTVYRTASERKGTER